MRTIILFLVIVVTSLLKMVNVELPVGQADLVETLVIISAALGGIYTRYIASRNLKTGGLLQPAPPEVIIPNKE